VGILRAVTATADDEKPALKVDVVPLEPQHLALPKSEGKGDGPAGRVAMPVGRLEKPLHLLHRPGG
jgi:hypothetical protein